MAPRLLLWCRTTVLVMLVIAGTRPAGAVPGIFNYKDALEKTLLFFEAQRSGKLPQDQRVKWRGDSGLKDGYQQGVDLVGGYYDSGDHVKFGLPMAYAVTMLAWSVVEFEKEIVQSSQLEFVLNAIKWGTDYFLKAHKQPNVLWAQVGDGKSDHQCWQRAEDMTTSRTAYKIDAENPGSDLAGETAAALAAASIAFKPYDSQYSQLLLLHAKQLFYFADTFRGSYDNAIPIVRDYYPSATGYGDELLWAAAWLFHATDDVYYLKYVTKNAALLGGTGWAVKEFSWDNKYAGLQVLLAKALVEGASDNKGNLFFEEYYNGTLKQYKAKAEFFMCACLQKNKDYNVAMTPGGLLYFDEWNNMQYVSSAAFLMTVYADYLTMSNGKLSCPDGIVQPSEILGFAKSQADYILGKNPKYVSYLVGYDKSYPLQVHHRGASIPSLSVLHTPVGCNLGFEQWFDRKLPNPNVIVGALVGGPDQKDQFADERPNYLQNEPSISATAPLVGLFARLAADQPKTPAYNHRHGNSPKAVTKPLGPPVEFVHTITTSWETNGITYYRHAVSVKNILGKPITSLKLLIVNLKGPIYGVLPTAQKNVYQLPEWIKVFQPNANFDFVYIQEGPQAKVSVHSYAA